MPGKKPFVRRFGQVDFDSMIALPGAAADDADIFVTRRGAFGANRTLTRAQIIAGAGVVPDPLLLNDGVIGAPSYSFSSNPITGTFLPALNQLGFAANGVEIARAQGVVGANQFIIAPGVVQLNAGFPSLAFGTGNTGFFESTDNNLKVTIDGTTSWQFSPASAFFGGEITGSPGFRNILPSATVPNILVRNNTFALGIGSTSIDQLNLIAGNLTCMSIRNNTGARKIGFYDGSPILLQTGVAVTTAAIHAALVNLRLFTA